MKKIKYYGNIEVECDFEIDKDDFEDFMLDKIGEYFNDYNFTITVHAKDTN